jgi:multidrug resistance efflux pump
MKLRIALVIALLAGLHSVAAHEGHETEPGRPTYLQVESGGSTYRVGLAFLPHGPVVGEDVRLDVQFVELLPAAPGSRMPNEQPVTGATVGLRIVAADHSAVVTSQAPKANPPGTYRAVVRFDRPGTYIVTARAEAAGRTIAAGFPLDVEKGPLPRTIVGADVVAGVLILLVGYSLVRRSTAAARPVLPRLAGVAAAGVAVLLLTHTMLGPLVGRAFLPKRPDTVIMWHAPMPGEVHTQTAAELPPESGAVVPAESFGAGDEFAGAVDVIATVIPAPGTVGDVVVPVTARVMLDPSAHLGSVVKGGQTLAVLEHHYILHDAVHMINIRWPLVAKMFETKRQMYERDLLAVRLRQMMQAGTVPAWAVQSAESAATQMHLEFARAQKLLLMHDAQITEKDLVKRPLQAPIAGTIDAVNFTQGQLAYENDRLFTVVDLSKVWVELRVPERLLAKHSPESTMTFVAAALPDARFTGTLARSSNQVDPVSRTIAYFFQVNNPAKQLRYGMRLSPVFEDRAATAGHTEAPHTAPATSASTDPAASQRSTVFTATGTVQPKAELIAQAIAPLWGRIEYAARRLNVGDVVKKDEVLANVILELSVDERYLMMSRAADIDAELEMSKLRKEQATQQNAEANARLKEKPEDELLKQEVQLTERALKNATEEESLLTRQKGAYATTIQRRDPKTTPVPAPISGVITEVSFRPGELNPTNEFRRLFTIVDTSRVWVEARIFENQSPLMLSRFKRATFTPAAGGPEIVLGRPISVGSTVDPQTRTVRVVFETANPGGRLKLGGSGQVTVEWN